MDTATASIAANALHAQRLRRAAAALLAVFVAADMPQAVATPSIERVIASVDAGQFQVAERAITDALAAPGTDPVLRDALLFERERMRRILLDFTLDEARLKARLRERIPDLAEAEFAQWKTRGLFERQLIDGRELYFQRAPSNLFRLSAEARTRRASAAPFRDGPMEKANAHHREVLEAAVAQGATSVAPRRLRVTQSLTVNADAVPAGKRIRAWIPYPRALPGQQEDIHFVGSTPTKHRIAPESTLQRTVHLERTAVAGKPTEFTVSYELTVYARHHAIDPSRVVPATIDAELAPFVAERAPHVVFTESLRLLSRQIVGDETHPWRIAQKLYAAVDRIPWAGAREYSTISNISDYALHAGHADCGQQTLLLIALLRLNGIPARWQSGMVWSDTDYSNLHDWGQLWIAPYGWIPMDVTSGRLDSDDPAIAGFYLGSQDAYRIAFNDDYSRAFVPAKQHFRSETVDLQRGEAEWSGGNLYFDQWDYAFAWKALPLPPRSGAGRKKAQSTSRGE